MTEDHEERFVALVKEMREVARKRWKLAVGLACLGVCIGLILVRLLFL